jgi:hypothetical protein
MERMAGDVPSSRSDSISGLAQLSTPCQRRRAAALDTTQLGPNLELPGTGPQAGRSLPGRQRLNCDAQNLGPNDTGDRLRAFDGRCLGRLRCRQDQVLDKSGLRVHERPVWPEAN